MTRFLLVMLLAVSARALDVPGFVYDDEGGVVKGAVVEARVAGASVAKTVTGEDGGFVFRGLPEGVVEIVSGDSSALVFGPDVVALGPSPGAERHPLPALRGEGTVVGTVTLNGKALAHAPIVIQGDDEVPAARVFANAKGEFRATGLAAQRYAVVPDERLHVGAAEEVDVVDLTKAREGRVVLALTATPVVRGRVLDAERKPVAHARVHIAFAHRSLLEIDRNVFTRTAPDGRFALAVPELYRDGKMNVAVSLPLHSTVRSKSFEIAGSDPVVDVTLPKYATVRVRVADRAGKPVSAARVGFVSRDDDDIPAQLKMFARRGPQVNEQGELTLRLAPDTYAFAIHAEGFQPGAATKTIAKPASVDVILDRAAALRGRVHRNGEGVADVSVMVRGGNPVVTDEKGAFAFDGLAPGSYELTLYRAEELIDMAMTTEAPADLDIALPAAGILRSRVIDASTNLPVREFSFEVSRVEGDGRVARGQQSDDGTFSVRVPEGTYRVSAGASGYTSSEPVEVRVSQREPVSIELRLGRGVTVTGRVTDEAGIPVGDATVLVLDDESDQRRSRLRVGPGRAQSAADGTFTITGVDRGEAAVTVRKEGFAPFHKTIDAEGTMHVDVRLTRGLSVQGIVTRGGRGVPRARVSASTAAVGGEDQPATTGDDGRFVITGLMPTRYTLSAQDEDRHAEVRDVDPTQDKQVVISLDAKQRGVVYGIVSGIPAMTGRGVVRRVVMVQSPDGGAEGEIDAAGNYRVENAPLGTVTVVAHVQSGVDMNRTSVRKQAEVIAGQPLRVDLELSGNVIVTGRVTHEGKALAGAQIGFTSMEGVMASATARDDGTYDVALPAAGRYHIFARGEQAGDGDFATIRDIRGGERIDIELREQVLEGTVIDANTRQPIAHATVSLGAALSMYLAAQVRTDANGRFTIKTSSAGPQQLVVSAAGYGHRALPVNNDTAHYLIDLAPSAELHVRVLDARSGTPLDAHLVVSEINGTFVGVPHERKTDATFRVPLAPGKYRLIVVARGYAAKVVEVTAPGSIDVMME